MTLHHRQFLLSFLREMLDVRAAKHSITANTGGWKPSGAFQVMNHRNRTAQNSGSTRHKTRSVFDRYDIVNEADLRTAVGRLAAPASGAASKANGQRNG